ncbi:MAG: serine hydrolase, partial [Bacteriovoracaceae bacterium]
MKLFIIFFVFSMIAFPQATTVPSYYSIDAKLTFAISTIFTELDLKNAFDTGEDGMVFPSIALIDLTTIPPRFAGIHAERFIYPASIYKMYVAAEVLHQVSQGKYPLTHTVIVQPPNTVDRMKEIVSDPRPLLRDGDTVNVNYLLELMITRSDNSAANCLIDLARRENINLMMQKYSWR